MRALLVYPKFPRTFWSFEAVLKLIGKKALLPPLGLVTVAAMLPSDWELRLVDRNLRDVTDEEWAWADCVLLTAMNVQKEDLFAAIATARAAGKPVVVGGPYVTSTPEPAAEAGADYLVLDEGEITIPPFLEHVVTSGLKQRDEASPPVYFRADGVKPEMSATTVPRFDLLDLDSYDGMAVQYSRGCPFLCEFCDIITLYGRRPRTKSPQQLLAELDSLYALGWRGPVFLVDDNFIGNKPNVKKLLPELRAWQQKHGYPFSFDTEASVDLAADPALMQLMVECRFSAVFIGIETPDEESLTLTRKSQNVRSPVAESVDKVTRAGLRVMCGMIIGFDNEKPGANKRIAEFAKTTSAPLVVVSMLQALPNTALWHRLEREGRLIDTAVTANQLSMNFLPTRPAAEIAREFSEVYAELYEPRTYLQRTYEYFLKLDRTKTPQGGPEPTQGKRRGVSLPTMKEVRDTLRIYKALGLVCWRQGVVRNTRFLFWRYAWSIVRTRREAATEYFVTCAHYEHFVLYRDLVRSNAAASLALLPDRVYAPARDAAAAVAAE